MVGKIDVASGIVSRSHFWFRILVRSDYVKEKETDLMETESYFMKVATKSRQQTKNYLNSVEYIQN